LLAFGASQQSKRERNIMLVVCSNFKTCNYKDSDGLPCWIKHTVDPKHDDFFKRKNYEFPLEGVTCGMADASISIIIWEERWKQQGIALSVE
jgi:ssDNA-binding Zn-finger/Zn-ribbon topoisomerase 1